MIRLLRKSNCPPGGHIHMQSCGKTHAQAHTISSGKHALPIRSISSVDLAWPERLRVTVCDGDDEGMLMLGVCCCFICLCTCIFVCVIYMRVCVCVLCECMCVCLSVCVCLCCVSV